MNTIKNRLEYLRGELRAERISYGELVELADLAKHIDPNDVELLEAAGVREGETMRTYEFTVTLRGYGRNPDEAWQDATEAADLSQDATPDDYIVYGDDRED